MRVSKWEALSIAQQRKVRLKVMCPCAGLQPLDSALEQSHRVLLAPQYQGDSKALGFLPIRNARIGDRKTRSIRE
jgi:hypothetical protein